MMKMRFYKLFFNVFFILSIAQIGYGKGNLISKEECVAFAKKMETEFNDGHPEVLSQSFDFYEFFKIVNARFPDTKYDIPFDESSVEKYQSRFRFGEEVYESVERGGFYNYVKYYSQGESNHIVFRLFNEDTGINYHDFELIKKDGRIKIADCFLLVTGEKLSQTVGNLMLQFIAATEPGDSLIMTAFTDLLAIKRINALIDSSNYEKALNVYNSTSDIFKKEKLGSFYLISIYMNLDENEYIKQIDIFEQKYPNDPSLNLVLIDGYFLRQNYDKALECIEVLEKQYGQDFILDYYKANINSHKAEYKIAAHYYEKVAAAKSDFRMAYESWLISCLEISDYSKVRELSQILNDRFGISRMDLKATFELYPDFPKSPGYKKFIKELK